MCYVERCSEGLATMIKPEDHDVKPGSVGTPVLGFDIRVIDSGNADAGEVPRGEPGEIVGTGTGLMSVYNNRVEQTIEETWTDERGRSFFKTGDIGKMDQDGYLYILDRKKDMIISGGYNVFPKDIEEIVGGNPAVKDVAVIAVPHSKWGESPLALVTAVDGQDIEPEELLWWANQRLSKAQRICAVEVRQQDFPRNVLGKVVKKDLRDPYWAPDFDCYWDTTKETSKLSHM